MRKNNREKILDTARRLLPRHGYHGVSLRAIAARAKLTTGAVYFHFKDKRDIYRTICFEAIDALVESFRKGIRSRKTPGQKLISTFDSYIDFYHRHRDRYNILMEYKSLYNPGGDDGSGEIAERMCAMTDLMEETIREGTRDGVFREVDPRMLSILLAAVAEGMLQLKKLGMFDHLKIADADFRKFMADIIGEGIQAPSGKP